MGSAKPPNRVQTVADSPVRQSPSSPRLYPSRKSNPASLEPSDSPRHQARACRGAGTEVVQPLEPRHAHPAGKAGHPSLSPHPLRFFPSPTSTFSVSCTDCGRFPRPASHRVSRAFPRSPTRSHRSRGHRRRRRPGRPNQLAQLRITTSAAIPCTNVFRENGFSSLAPFSHRTPNFAHSVEH